MINLIAAIDLNRGIGSENDLLVKLPSDMKHFRELTTGHFIVMGRRTFDSIGHPLPNRTNIILTRNKKHKAPHGTFVYHSIEEVIHAYHMQNHDESELFIIGGAEVYSQAIQYADRLYLTIIDHEFPNVDSFFPAFSMLDWKPVNNVENKADENNLYDHYFVTYERRNKNN
jgi:dihydrofolate reductase